MDNQPNYDPKKWVVYSSKIGESSTIEAQRAAVTAAAQEAGATIEASFCIEGFENDEEGKARCSEMFDLAVNYTLRRRAVLVMPCLTVLYPIFNVLQRQLFDRHVPAKILGLSDDATRNMFLLGYECATLELKYQQQAATDCQQDKDAAVVEADNAKPTAPAVDDAPAAEDSSKTGGAPKATPATQHNEACPTPQKVYGTKNIPAERIEEWRKRLADIFAAFGAETLSHTKIRKYISLTYGYAYAKAGFLIVDAARLGIIEKTGNEWNAPYKLIKK